MFEKKKDFKITKILFVVKMLLLKLCSNISKKKQSQNISIIKKN